MPFQPFHNSRFTRGSVLVSEPDSIPDEALRLAQNVRLDRTLGAIEVRPGWSIKTPVALGASIATLTKLFSQLATYAYAQVGANLQRLTALWASPTTIATPGTQTLSHANSPDGKGHLLKYFVNGTIAVKDDGVTTTIMGIAPPTAAPLTAALAADLSTQIDDMDVAAHWTASNLASGPVDDLTNFNGPATDATSALGAGANGTVTITALNQGFVGNIWTVEAVAGVGLNVPLSALIGGTALTVTLGTDGAGALDPTKNTATLVRAVINALAGVPAAVASGTGVTPLTAPEGPHTFTGGRGKESVSFTIAASTFGSVSTFAGAPINLDTLTGGDNTVKGDDYIHLWIRTDHPEYVTFVQLDVDIDSATTAVADAFRHNYYSVRLGSLTSLSQGIGEWTELQVRKSAFARYGTDTSRSWANARGFRIGFLTNTLGTVSICLDDFKLRGGVGLEGDIKYTVTYRNSNTMARGNPPKDADGIVLYTTAIAVNRQRVNLTISNVVQGGAAHPGDSQIDTLMIYRQGGVFATAVLVDEIADISASPYTDSTSDATLVLSPIQLELDNNIPPIGSTRVLFGPDATGHFFLLVDGYRLYISKPYEDRENRVENWPTLGFAVCADGSNKALAGAADATQIRVWTGEHTKNVVGVGQDTFLPVTLDGTRGIVGQFAQTSGDGVFFFVSQDGIYSDIGGRQQKLTGAIDPFFQGKTIDGQAGLTTDPAVRSLTQLGFLHEPTGSLLCMLYAEGTSTLLNRFFVLKPNLQNGQLSEVFFGSSALTNLQSLYLDTMALELLAGTSNGHVYRIEDPNTYSDNGMPLDFLFRTKSYDFGQPQHAKLIASSEVEGSTASQVLTLKAYYDRAQSSEVLGSITTASETGLVLLPTADSTLRRRDVALELSGSTIHRVVLTRLGCFFEPQPELLTFLDSGNVSFDFIQQLKRFEFDINLPVLSTLIIYADQLMAFSGTFVVTSGRANVPYYLPPGLRGRLWRVTLRSTGEPFLCYRMSGFFKQLGTDQQYQERVMIQGV